MRSWSIARLFIFAFWVLSATPSGAQHAIDPVPPAIGNDRDLGVNQLKQFGTYDVFKVRVKQDNASGKSIEDLLAEDKAEASALVAHQKLQCTVTDAVLVAVDAAAHTKTFEVACADSAGYFLVQSDSPGGASGFTCFAADAARAADLEAKREPGIGCALPANAGVKPMAAAILAKAGKTCAITELKWLGQSSTTDFVELACAEGTGFVLRTPLPGSAAPQRLSTCAESAASGLACRLAANDTTLATLNAALAGHNFACTATAVHVIGREAVKRRRVVEYFCPAQHPNGLVAFLPTEGSSAPFEALDCGAAAKRQVVCILSKVK